jgi:hypothetical protein
VADEERLSLEVDRSTIEETYCKVVVQAVTAPDGD